MPRQQSKIWTYYTKTNNITAKCKQCFKEIKHCRNTTNLFKHASTHKIVVDVQQGKQKKKVADKTENYKVSETMLIFDGEDIIFKPMENILESEEANTGDDPESKAVTDTTQCETAELEGPEASTEQPTVGGKGRTEPGNIMEWMGTNVMDANQKRELFLEERKLARQRHNAEERRREEMHEWARDKHIAEEHRKEEMHDWARERHRAEERRREEKHDLEMRIMRETHLHDFDKRNSKT